MRTTTHLPKRIFFCILVFMLTSLACGLPDSGSDLAATNAVLQQTADAVSNQATQQASSQQTAQAQPPTPVSTLKPDLPVPPVPPTRQPPQQGAPLPTESSGASAGTGEFYIANNTTALTICYFYMTLSSETEWGPDRLGEGTTIVPGDTFTLTDVPYGTYDALAADCDENVLAEIYQFDFPANDTFTLYDQ